jgi:hypothetical protein
MLRFLLLCTVLACGKSQQAPQKSGDDAMQAEAAMPVAPSPSVATRGEPSVYATLDAIGGLARSEYEPRPVVAAVNELQVMGRKDATALLAEYFKTRGTLANDRQGLFAVLRVLYEPPSPKPPWPKDACTPNQQEFLSGPCLRPPRIGSPVPSPPADLRSLRYPIFVLGDVPLSLVGGYDLAGKAEIPSMHFEDLVRAKTGWLAAPLLPKTKDEIRNLFIHYGQWSFDDEVGKGIATQLEKL